MHVSYLRDDTLTHPEFFTQTAYLASHLSPCGIPDKLETQGREEEPILSSGKPKVGDECVPALFCAVLPPCVLGPCCQVSSWESGETVLQNGGPVSQESCSQTQWYKLEIPATLEDHEFKANLSNLVRPHLQKCQKLGRSLAVLGLS